jgi:hypothetical protein
MTKEGYIEVSEENGRLEKDQFADAGKTMPDELVRDFEQLQKYYADLRKVAENLRLENMNLKQAINSALDYLVCMDRLDEEKSNEQAAMDVLSEVFRQTWRGCFQNGNSHKEEKK